jgi:preprotein translocase SecF subunit
MYRPVHLIPANTRIDFMRWHKVTFAFSLLLVLGSFALIFFKGLNFGIDFRGGILMEVQTQGPADLAGMRSQLDGLGLGEVALQEFGSPNDVLIRLQHQSYTEADRQQALEQVKKERPGTPADELTRLSAAKADGNAQLSAVDKVKQSLGSAYSIRRTEFVGPKVGGELIQDAIWAIILSMVGIMGYVWFRYEWQFGVNALAALAHDCVTTVGLFALLGYEFNLTTVAAVLTIAGYSVNDTVVIYDRIRSELRRYKTMPLAELLNLSINETLPRTVMTSGMTLLSVLALYFFGGEVIRGFSLAMIWGIVIGTYSTIYVAAPMLIYMRLRRERVGPAAKSDADKAAASRP